MSEELQEPLDDIPADDELESAPAEEVGDDEVIPAARKLSSYDGGALGDADEALPEGANLTVSAKEAERKALEEAMQRFLQGGGRIQQVPADASVRNKPQE